MKNKKLSLIILTYNSEKDIYDCLDSVFKYNDIGDELEIIVVDNASKGYETMRRNLLERHNGRLRVLSNTMNGGYGQGNNIGIRASSAPYFLIMNPDVRLIMPIFQKTINTLSQNNVAMCGYKSMENLQKPNASFGYTHTTNGLVRLFGWKRLGGDNYDPQNMFLLGACFAMKKVVFEQIGMFDENIFLYGEENDIHYRLRKTFPHARIMYDKELKYIHPMLDREVPNEVLGQTWKSRFYFYKKNNLSLRGLYLNEWLIIQLNRLIVMCKHPDLYTKQKECYKERLTLLRGLFQQYAKAAKQTKTKE